MLSSNNMKDSNRQQPSHLCSFLNAEAVIWNPPAIFHTWPETARWRNFCFLICSRPTIKCTKAIYMLPVRCAGDCKYLNTLASCFQQSYITHVVCYTIWLLCGLLSVLCWLESNSSSLHLQSGRTCLQCTYPYKKSTWLFLPSVFSWSVILLILRSSLAYLANSSIMLMVDSSIFMLWISVLISISWSASFCKIFDSYGEQTHKIFHSKLHYFSLKAFTLTITRIEGWYTNKDLGRQSITFVE